MDARLKREVGEVNERMRKLCVEKVEENEGKQCPREGDQSGFKQEAFAGGHCGDDSRRNSGTAFMR